MESVVVKHGIRLGNAFDHYMKAFKSPSDQTMLGNGSLGFVVDARIHSAEKAWLTQSEPKIATNAMHLACPSPFHRGAPQRSRCRTG